jgi:hypothetical protein
MKKMMSLMLMAAFVVGVGMAKAEDQAAGTEVKTEKKAEKKMTCRCAAMYDAALKLTSLTAEQKEKVTKLQSECKQTKECCKTCSAGLKETLTPEQFKEVKKACMPCKGCCSTKKTDAEKAEKAGDDKK